MSIYLSLPVWIRNLTKLIKNSMGSEKLPFYMSIYLSITITCMDKKLDQATLCHQELGDKIDIPVPGSAIALVRLWLVEPEIVRLCQR